uniref:Kinesin light chain n=1 Tax=Trieres chinensis TaxID=1514140 RepID=A0A7S1ZIR8_TRICV|mmetsp:Transcript_26215/g.53720  ORF Transcript_26215/g.53720 Transcript_26215/m.53720 type:complete len:450 (+) Transcript_26215:65-1414(+)
MSTPSAKPPVKESPSEGTEASSDSGVLASPPESNDRPPAVADGANAVPRKGKPPGRDLSVFAAIFGECLCTDAFRFRPSDIRSSLSSARSRTPFLYLEGVECIGLGAVVVDPGEKPKGHTPSERVRETVRQITTEAGRLIKIGYLVEKRAGEEASTFSNGDGKAEENLDKERLGVELPKDPSNVGLEKPVTTPELVPLEVYEETYPGDLERSLTGPARDALNHFRSGEFSKAFVAFEKIAKQQRFHPKKEDDTFLLGITMHNMGVCRLLAMDDDAAALKLFERAADLKRKSFGPDHVEVAASLVEIGIQRFARSDLEEALTVLAEARKMRSLALGSDHPKVAVALNNEGCVHFQQKNPVAALTRFQEAADALRNAMERGGGMRAEMDLLHVATALCNLAYMKFRMKGYDEATAIFEDALLVQQSVLGDEEHRTIRDTLSNIAITNAFHS